MLKLAEERVLQFKFSDLEGQSYRTSGPPAAIWCGKTDRKNFSGPVAFANDLDCFPVL
jgi:hypothetical protein